ncbi:MAG: hypothetical protein SGCHY_001259 [Lobulomycetales sp.]
MAEKKERVLQRPRMRRLGWAVAVLAGLLLVSVSLHSVSLTGRRRTAHVVAVCGPAPRLRLVYGVFSMARLYRERAIVRDTWMKLAGTCSDAGGARACVDVRFVLGRVEPGLWERIRAENATHGDIVQLDIPENKDAGKLQFWFEYASVNFADAQYIGKGDMDTFVLLHQLVDVHLSRLPVADSVSHHLPVVNDEAAVYFGRIGTWDWCAGGPHCPKTFVFMLGQFYALSMPLVQYITDPVNAVRVHALDDIVSADDVQMGYWLHGYPGPITHYALLEEHQPWLHPVKNIKSFPQIMDQILSDKSAPRNLHKAFFDQ